MLYFGLDPAVVCVLLVVAIHDMNEEGGNDDDGMDEEEEENDGDDMEEEQEGGCGAWCVCALLCCVALEGSTEGSWGWARRGKKSLYIGKY